MAGLLVYDPRERLIGKDALLHPFFDGLDRATIGRDAATLASSSGSPEGAMT